jgi:hypothetical protein
MAILNCGFRSADCNRRIGKLGTLQPLPARRRATALYGGLRICGHKRVLAEGLAVLSGGHAGDLLERPIEAA